MLKRNLISDGLRKQVYDTDDPDVVVIHFKDTVTAYNNIRKAVLEGKGVVNNAISSLLFSYLAGKGIRTHFLSTDGGREQMCRRTADIPIKMVVHNYVAGPLAQKLALQEGLKPPAVIYDLIYSTDGIDDLFINDSQALALGIAGAADLEVIYATARRINDILTPLFARAGLKLVDMQPSFRRDTRGEIILAGEISPDTCRIWDAETDEKLDRDRFRHDLGKIVASYEKVYQKLSGLMAAQEA